MKTLRLAVVKTFLTITANSTETSGEWRQTLAGKLEGTVVSISESGSAVTDIAIERLNGIPQDESVSISCEGHSTIRIFPTDHQQPEMTFLAFKGPTGFLELTLVGDDVSIFLGISPGKQVTVKW